MSKTATVIFDGSVLRPEKPIEMVPNRRYVITFEEAPSVEKIEDAWDVLERIAGTVDAPPDWSVEHDHYLHGTPKHTPEFGS